MSEIQNQSAINLQAIIEDERQKRIDAENMSKALIEEFRSCSDFDDVRTKFKEKIREIAPQALINITNLMTTAESESVRANLNKWVLEWAMSDKIDGSGSEISKLIDQLKKNPTPTPNEVT
jgi:hypothetical protein